MALGHGLAEFLEAPGLTAAIAHHASGELASALGDPDLALEHFLAVGEQTADDPVSPELLPWRAGAALALLRRGRGREAAELAERHHAEALATGSPYAIAVALRTLAATGTGDRRVELLRKARSTLDGVPADRLLAQIDTDLAGALVLSQRADTTEALAMLRAAERYAGRQELWPLQGRVRRLLDHLGEAPQQIDSEAMAVTDRGRTAGGGARRRGADQPADRRAPPGERQGGRVAPLERLPEAGDPLAQGAHALDRRLPPEFLPTLGAMAERTTHSVLPMGGRDPHEEHRAATPLELLFDLTFVIAFGVAADELAHLIADRPHRARA